MSLKRSLYPLGLICFKPFWESYINQLGLSTSVRQVFIGLWFFYFWTEVIYVICDYVNYLTDPTDVKNISFTAAYIDQTTKTRHSYFEDLEEVLYETQQDQECQLNVEDEYHQSQDEKSEDSEEQTSVKTLLCYQGKKLVQEYPIPKELDLESILNKVDPRRELPWRILNTNSQEEMVAIVPPDNWPRDRLRLVMREISEDSDSDSSSAATTEQMEDLDLAE